MTKNTADELPPASDALLPDFGAQYGSGTRAAAQMDFTWRLFIIARKWRARVDELQSAGQLTHARLEALASLDHLPAGVQQNELARFMRVEGPTLVRILDRLESDGLIERLPHPVDGRRKTVALTPAGRALMAERLAISAQLRDAVLSGISHEELSSCIRTLDKVLSKLEHS